MGVRYRADWTNIAGTEYRIDIIDTAYSSSVLSADIATDGFTLRYDGTQDNPYNPILSSSVTLTLKSLLSDSAFQTFITDLSAADEERFILAVYKKIGAAYVIEWIGYILTDLISDEDTSPGGYFTITATDGFKRLEGIDYDNSGTLYTDKATMLEHIFIALNKINLQSYWGDTDSFLKTAVNWYENAMYTTAPADTLDPLTLARVAHDNFITTGKDKQLHALNCYEVLTYICRTFGAQLKLSGGQYMFVQPNELINSTFKSRTYYKAGTIKSAIANEDFKFTPTIGRTDGKYSYLPPLGKVTAKYLYKQGTNLNNLLPAVIVNDTDYVIGDIEGGNGQSLIFSGIIHEIMAGIESIEEDIIAARIYHFKIKVGTYYFTNKNGTAEWTETSTDRYIHNTGIENGNFNWYKNITFIASDIPADGELTFAYKYYRLEDWDGAEVTLTEGITFTQTPSAFKLSIYLADGTIQEGTVDYEAINTSDGSTPVRANSIYEHGELYIGDGPDAYSTGRIEIYDGSTWNNAADWKIAGAGTAYGIGDLLVREIMAGRKAAVKTWNGKFTGDISAHHVIVIGSDYYVLLEATFNANYSAWTGTWYKIVYANTNIVNQTPVKYSEETNTVIRESSTSDEYEPAFSKNTAFNKTFGSDVGNVVEIGTNLVASKIVETDVNKKLVSVDKGTAYNKAFGDTPGAIIPISTELTNGYVPYYSDGVTPGLKNSPIYTDGVDVSIYGTVSVNGNLRLSNNHTSWLQGTDYAGNVANLLRLSTDNLIEFGQPVAISSLYHVANQELTDIVDIPVNGDSVCGTEIGVGISIAGIRIFSVSGIADGSGGLSSYGVTFTPTNLTTGYLPYKSATVLADSPIFTDGTVVSIGFSSSLSKFSINGGLHVGGESDAGDNNLLVDGTGTFVGRVLVDNITDATNTTDGSLQTDGGLSVAKKGYFGDNVTVVGRISATTYGSDGSVTDAELLRINSVTSNVQDQLNGKQNTLTFGIANTNAVKINSADVASGEYARFTTTGLEGRTGAELLGDIGVATYYVPYTGATGSVTLGTYNLTAANLILGVNNTSWLKGTDYAGNSANLIKLSSDNLIEFGFPVSISSLYHVANQELSDIVNIPVNGDSVSGTEIGVGISVAGIRLFRISGIADGSGGLVDDEGNLYIEGNVIVSGNISGGGISGGANAALSNLASVAINTTLVSDTDNTDALGTTAIAWSDLFLGSGGVITWNSAPSTPDITLTHSADTLTLDGGNFALGTNSITMTGSIGTTGARLTKGWFADLEVTNAIVGSITGNAATVTVADEAADTTSFIGFYTAASGSLAGKTNTNMTFNASTGVVTFASSVLTTTDINGGTIDGATIGATSATTIVGTTITANTGFMPDVNDGAYLGQSGTAFSDLFLASGGVINWNAGASTITHAANLLTIGGSGATTLALGTNSITLTGSIGATGARVTKGWFVDAEFTNVPTIGGNALGTIYAAVAQTFYIGTTQVAINRASAALTLAGLTLTTPDIGTPSAGTLTNCGYLPVSGITSSTATALGVGSLEIGHASDTTLTRVSAGVAAIEGKNIYLAGGTDVAVADGGTGKSAWTQYLLVYADTTGSLSQIAIGTAGQVLTSNGAGSPPSFQLIGGETVQALSGTSVSFDIDNGRDATLTLSGNTTITFSNLTAGDKGNLYIIGHASTTYTVSIAGYTVLIPVSSLSTGDALAVSGAGKKDLIVYWYTGAVLIVGLAKDLQ